MMDDLISRKAAINAIGEKPLAWEKGEYEQGLQNQWERDVDAIKTLQPAEPEQRWIPVTKDSLPEEGKVVIVKGEKGTWDVGTYRGYSHIVGLEDIHRWIWKKNTSKKVYWWMYKDGALPEPYREEGGE